MAFLGGTSGKISIIIQAVDKASQHLKKVGDEATTLGAKLKASQAQIGAVGLGLTALGAAGLYAVTKLAHSAADVEALTRAFNQLKKGSTLSLEALKKAAGDTVSQVDLLRSANTAMMLAIDPEALPEMMEIARQSAIAMGISTTEAFDSMARGVGRQSKLILDNLGIVFDASTAYEEYAESLGKTAQQLSDSEKRQAYLSKALEVGRQHVEELGDVTGGATETFQRMRASVEDLKAELGKYFLPVVIAVVDKIAGIVKWATEAPPAMKVLAAGLAVGVIALAGLTGALILATKAMAMFHAVSGPTGWAILAVAAAVGIAASLWIKSMMDMEESTDSAADSVKDFHAGTKSKLEDLKRTYETKIKEIGDTTNEGLQKYLIGDAQAKLEAFKNCAVSKEIELVDEIDSELDRLYSEYEDNTNMIISLRKAGKDDEAAIYEARNKDILSKIKTLEDIKQQVVTAGNLATLNEIEKHLGEYQGEYDANNAEIERLLGEGKTGEAQVLIDRNKELLGYAKDDYLKALEDEYSSNEKEIQRLRDAGKTEEARLLELKNAEILSKIKQYSTDSETIVDSSYDARIDTVKTVLDAQLQAEKDYITDSKTAWKDYWDEYWDEYFAKYPKEEKGPPPGQIVPPEEKPPLLAEYETIKAKTVMATTPAEIDALLAEVAALILKLPVTAKTAALEETVDMLRESISEGGLSDMLKILTQVSDIFSELKTIIVAQHGGVFTKPTLTLLGEKGPEAVIPLSKLQPVTGIARAEEGGLFREPTLALVAEKEPEALIPLRYMRETPKEERAPITFHTDITVTTGSISSDVDLDRLADKIVRKQMDEVRASRDIFL